MVFVVNEWNMDDKMLAIIKKHNIPYVLMHMNGTPKTMQKDPNYTSLINDIIGFLSEKVNQLKEYGIRDIIIDPGFGFGKTISDNYKLLKNLESLKVLNLPILIGLSRKSMIYKILETSNLNSINGTTALNMFALSKGAKILRVHDVKQAIECIKLNQEINKN